MTWWGGSSKSVILYASGLDVFPLDEYFTGQTSLGLPRRWQPQDKAGRGVQNVNIAHQHSFKLPWQLFTEPWSVTEWVTAILEKDKKTKMFSFSIDCVVTPCSQCLWEPLECKSNLRMHVKDLHWPLCNLYLVSTDFEAFPTSKNCSAGSLIMHRISILSRLFPTALLHSQ